MLGEILSWMTENYPQFAGFVIIAIILVVATWKVSCFYIETKKATEKMNGIEPLLQKISQSLATLNTVLVEKNIISQSVFSQENSPRVMNDIGRELYEKSGAKELYEAIKDELLQDVEKIEINSFLEAERACVNTLLAKMDDIRFKDVQNFAYEHPTFLAHPLVYTDIIFVMALNLRDEYIKTHPGKLKDL